MKTMKKLTSLLLTLLLILSLGVTAAAAEGGDTIDAQTTKTGSITISNAIPGETYKLYKLLELVSYSPDINTEVINGETVTMDNGQYSYKIEDAWKKFFATDDAKIYFTEVLGDDRKGTGYVTWSKTPYTGTDVVNFTQLAIKYANDPATPIAPVCQYECPGKADGSMIPVVSYIFEDLPLGYYMIDSSMGSLCALTTTNPDVTVTEKNTAPKNDKKVQEGPQWMTQNDAAIGDAVNFRSMVDFESGIENLLFHDKMDAGLTFNPDSVAVILDPTDVKASDKQTNLVPNTHYRVITKKNDAGELTALEDGCTFHIQFLKTKSADPITEDFYKLITTGTHSLKITYSAILNKNAVVKGEGNKNVCKVSFGEKNRMTTESTTTTKTWEVPVYKYTSEGGTSKGLADTKFTLSLNDDGSEPIQLVKDPDKPAPVTDKDGHKVLDKDGKEITELWRVYHIATAKEIQANTATTEIVTGESGKFWIRGLDSKTYYLTETAPTDGYNMLDKPVTIVMKNDGTFRKNETDALAILIQNNAGSLLPSTGGIGTTVFYVVGSILLVGAGVLLVTKKRMSNEK